MFAHHSLRLSRYLVFLVLLCLTLSFFFVCSPSSSTLLALPSLNLFFSSTLLPFALTTFYRNLHLSLRFSISPLYLRRSFLNTLLSDLSSVILNLSFLSLACSLYLRLLTLFRKFSPTRSLFFSLFRFPSFLVTVNSTLSISCSISLSDSCSSFSPRNRSLSRALAFSLSLSSLPISSL